MNRLPNILLVPTMDCPGSCAYCFGPYQESVVMDAGTVSATADWIVKLQEELDQRQPAERGAAPPQDRKSPAYVIFHGGEPLAAGLDFYKMALPILRKTLGHLDLHLSVLSNLWLLDDAYVDLFTSQGMAVGASLDGPEEINDRQRGRGYFARTMAGLEKIRNAGQPTFCMCTFSRDSAARAGEVFDFFYSQGIDFDFKNVLPSFESRNEQFVLTPDECVDLIQTLMDKYLASDGKIRIRTLHQLLRTIVTRQGPILGVKDCIGQQLAVGPEGEIFNCQRFAGKKDFVWARIQDSPSLDTLFSSAWSTAYNERLRKVEDECCACSYFDICRGGCAYNHLASEAGDKKNGAVVKDPYCETYRAILDYITGVIHEEMYRKTSSEKEVHRGKMLQAILKSSG